MKNDLRPVTIFGLGYVGLPLSLSYSMKGFKVFGIDINETLVNELKAGITHLHENHGDKSIQQILQECLKSGNFLPTTDASEALAASNKFILTVGIPVKNETVDYDPVISACSTIARGLKTGDTVIIRSTLVPGTTENKLIPILESSGLKAGDDFHVVYCPERISEGNAFYEFENVPVIIAGINSKSMSPGTKVIKMISNVDPVPVSSIKIAETAKVVENIQRDVNIAMVQQLADFCRKLGISIFELIQAANTHPRVNLLKPGPGVGGYCIPNALYYLKPTADELGVKIDLLSLSRRINHDVPDKICHRIRAALLDTGRKPSNSKVAILGIAMKDYCSDDRQSPVIDIVNTLQESGISVSAYDPCVATGHPFKTDDLSQCLLKADCLLISAVQEGINYSDFNLFKALMNEKPIIFDTRNTINIPAAKDMGFTVISL